MWFTTLLTKKSRCTPEGHSHSYLLGLPPAAVELTILSPTPFITFRTPPPFFPTCKHPFSHTHPHTLPYTNPYTYPRFSVRVGVSVRYRVRVRVRADAGFTCMVRVSV